MEGDDDDDPFGGFEQIGMGLERDAAVSGVGCRWRIVGFIVSQFSPFCIKYVSS